MTTPAADVTRFVGCLMGGALGDALGYPVEFVDGQIPLDRVLGPGMPDRLPARPGELAVVSDDTQMTLFTAEGLLRAARRLRDHGACDVPAMLQDAYHRWLFTQTGEGGERWLAPAARGWLLDVRELHERRAPGNTCLRTLQSTSRTQVRPTVAAPPNDSKGCGAVMRSAPIGLGTSDAEAAFSLARDAAVLTHGHPSGYLSAAYFAAVVHAVARDVPLRRAMDAADEMLRAHRGADETMAAIAAARSLAAQGPPSRADIQRLGGGWVGEEALAIALLCAMTTPDGSPSAAGAALRRSVAHNGDSDSTGSLTGNLLGAIYGEAALPEAWLRGVELRGTVERLARDLHATTVLGLAPDPRRYPPR